MEVPDWAFISSEKKVVRFVPEKTTKILKYNENQWSFYFGIKDKRLKLSNIGLYSIARPAMRKMLLDNLKNIVKLDDKIVTETHGGLGGFTMALAGACRKVQAIELNPVHASIIKNNMKVLGFNNVEVINKDYFEIFMQLDQDIIISDPPWGGYDYKDKETVSLGVNNVNIMFIINELFKENKFAVFILLAPHNYNIADTEYLEPELKKNMEKHFVDAKKKHYFLVFRNNHRLLVEVPEDQ